MPETDYQVVDDDTPCPSTSSTSPSSDCEITYTKEVKVKEDECVFLLSQRTKRRKTDEHKVVSLDSDDDGDNDSEISTSLPASSSSSSSSLFKILTLSEVTQEMNMVVFETTGIISIPDSTTRKFLEYFKWKQETLVTEFYQHGVDTLTEKVGLFVPSSNLTEMDGTCKVCLTDDLTHQDVLEVSCCHYFCKECWRNYLRNQIMQEGAGNRISCMESGPPACPIILDDSTVTDLIAGIENHSERKEVMKRYQRGIITSSFIQSNHRFSLCPNPVSCDFVVKVTQVHPQKITCDCGHVFCFQCKEGWHYDIITCRQLEAWKKETASDSVDLAWLASHAKCPNCHTAIEKNGGNDYMTCPNCQSPFCWQCLMETKGHVHLMVYHAFTANPFLVEKEKGEKLKIYQGRWKVQEESIGMERGMRKAFSEDVQYLKTKYSIKEWQVSFLLDGLDSLDASRRLLMSSFVFAFYAEDTVVVRARLKDLQQRQDMLNDWTEGLSGFLENNVTEKMSAFKQEHFSPSGKRSRSISRENVIHEINVIKKDLKARCKEIRARRMALLGVIRGGYAGNEWKFQGEIRQ